MPDRLAISLGGLVGLTVMGCALAWALAALKQQYEAPYGGAF